MAALSANSFCHSVALAFPSGQVGHNSEPAQSLENKTVVKNEYRRKTIDKPLVYRWVTLLAKRDWAGC